MNTDIDKLLVDAREILEQIEQLFDAAQKKFRYTLDDGRVVISREVKLLQKQYKTSLINYLFQAKWKSLLSAPIIYNMIVLLAILDASITIYQHICFRIYGIPVVTRRE